MYLWIIIFLFSRVYPKEITVKTSDELTEAVYGNNTVIVDGEINLKDEILLQPGKSGTVHLIIRGLHRKKSVISFSDLTKGLTFDNVTSVEIENITIRGRLNFKGQDYVKVHEVDHYGIFDTTRIGSNGYVHIKNYLFEPQTQKARANSVKFNSGRTIIENSEFIGNPGSTESLIKYVGKTDSVNDLSILNSKFDGNYLTSAVIVQVGNVTIQNCIFYNGFSKNKG
ncbi:hypothetical protein PIROE2DRAFT_5097 [Piromyces sp. E2]|nr:hypothetical protein PIROE2DRAFT_5097 [Piromyces sp. E2]|eukprot:OUM67459.1 hypothetical protein PIROE2DRAFT_5097 [Piromyces sp. E2]